MSEVSLTASQDGKAKDFTVGWMSTDASAAGVGLFVSCVQQSCL